MRFEVYHFDDRDNYRIFPPQIKVTTLENPGDDGLQGLEISVRGEPVEEPDCTRSGEEGTIKLTRQQAMNLVVALSARVKV